MKLICDFRMKQAVGSLLVYELCAIVIKTLKEFFVMAKEARKIILACECGKMTLHKETK